ncbi:MAG TPA: hypothetical protein VMF10_11945 [Candidatus Aquilonibacter sp.]|nr:hypothetical protein [Candidatus Aquilonibacter sp.]
MRRFTKPIRMVAGLLTGLLFAALVVPLGAQPARQPHQFYDISREVTLSGTVSDVLAKATPATLPGPHLLFATSSGKVDASLGRFALQGKDPLSVAPGKEVQVTGIMKTVRGKNVFIARIIKVDGKAYNLRNQHGVPMSPLSRERAGQKAAQKGESL